jgi:catechol 2,3-dioxygenase-like lactoylglutathione lyase family enzyme
MVAAARLAIQEVNMLANAPIAAVLPCVDMARARDFYGGILGLTEAPMPGVTEEQYAEGAMYQCGAGTLLFVYQRPEPTRADHTAAAWMVSDLDAVVDALISKGVRLEVYDLPETMFDERGIATYGEFKTAWFKDPEGNILAVNQMPG